MKLYKVINTRTGKVVRYRETKSKREASTGKMTQDRVVLDMNEKQYADYMKEKEEE